MRNVTRPALLCISSLLMAASGCHRAAQPKKDPDMASAHHEQRQPEAPTAFPVATVNDLIRFRIVDLPGGARVVAALKWREELPHDQVRSGVRWQVYAFDSARGKARLEREVTQETSAHDFDIATREGAILWLIEENSSSFLAITIAAKKPDAGNIVPIPAEVEDFAAELPAARNGQVEVGTPWHAHRAPEQWLFAARARAGRSGNWLLACNTLDGKILQLSGPLPRSDAGGRLALLGEPKVPTWKEEAFGPKGLYPVAVEGRGTAIVASVQATLAQNLFWSLGNYNTGRPELNPRGILTVQRFGAGGGVTTLAALGPVWAIDLDQDRSGRLVLVAAHAAKTGAQVAVLSSDDDGATWQPVASFPTVETVGQVAIRAAADGTTTVGFAFRDGDAWVIKAAVLAPRR
jgi:hypothetical protein